MCGHGTIGTVTIAVENRLVEPRVPGRLDLETPAGKVSVTYREERGKVRSVRLTNVPSFLHSSGLEPRPPHSSGGYRGRGGAYALAGPARRLGLTCPSSR